MPDKIFTQLFNTAKRYLDRAYSPYSKVKVASSVIMKSGKVFSGCNIENASYGGTICAERVAITKAISEATSPAGRKIQAILVVTNQDAIWPPCGICRQVIAEFSTKSTVVYIADLNKNFKKIRFTDLFPGAFGPEYLQK